MRNLPSWVRDSVAAKSLLKALELEDPAETLLLQLTISELSLVSLSLSVISRVFPEFAPLAEELSTKVIQVSEAQNFLTKGEE